MRNSFVWWSTAAAIAFGFSIAGLNTANAESVMRACASQWKQAQPGERPAARAGRSFWRSAVRARSSPASTAASAPGPSVRLAFPMVAAVGAGFRRGVKVRRRPKRHETVREPMERRQGGGNDRRPELATVSVAMPHAPRLGRRVVRRFRSAPAPAPAPAPASQSGSLFPWWQQSAPSSAPPKARPRPRGRANTRPNSRRARGAHRTPSFGPTRRLASITTREPAISGIPSTARICARLTRAPPDIAQRGTANVRRRPLLDRRWRALRSLSSCWRPSLVEPSHGPHSPL